MSKNIVVITGFGPFRDIKVNASWQAVQLVPEQNFEDVEIVIKEIPVAYEAVNTLVPQLWEKYNPVLVVHVGVSSQSHVITIESQAFRNGYVSLDCMGRQLSTNEICSSNDGANCIKANLDVNRICTFVNESTNVKTFVSKDAGRFLCEYIFYKSLSINPERTLFVHVPPINQPYTVNELAEAISMIVKCALKQLNCSS